jgi:hypothetical protein
LTFRFCMLKINRNELTPIVERIFTPVFLEYWPVLVYAKWAAIRGLLNHIAAKLGVDSVLRFLTTAIFPLGIDRFFLFRGILPLVSKLGNFLFQWLYNSFIFFIIFMTALG